MGQESRASLARVPELPGPNGRNPTRCWGAIRRTGASSWIPTPRSWRATTSRTWAAVVPDGRHGQRYSLLDQYAMGYVSESQVPASSTSSTLRTCAVPPERDDDLARGSPSMARSATCSSRTSSPSWAAAIRRRASHRVIHRQAFIFCSRRPTPDPAQVSRSTGFREWDNFFDQATVEGCARMRAGWIAC